MREELIWVWHGIYSVKINRMKYAVKFIFIRNAVRQRRNL